MAFVIALTLAFLFLDGWLRYAVIAGGALIEIAEITVWLRWRNVAAKSGVETMIGMTGVTITDCDPDGQIKIKGQIWKAHANEKIDAGEPVRITGIDGLLLTIAPL
jgi:membrane-bound serine protease (ClpP class)